MNRFAGALVALAALSVSMAGCLEDVPDGDPVPAGWDGLTFRTAVDLGTQTRIGAVGTSCLDSAVEGDCGLGEPSVEVDAAGTIYVSGVCCVTAPPPVYVSRDGGETFELLKTDDGVREVYGIEGDFAVDALGRVYFSDIELAATFQVTVWDADGTYLHHTKWPATPLVDRDWIRAEGDGVLYFVYNTGGFTRVYKSMDTGRTWTPDAIYEAEYALGNVAILPEQELCLFGGSMAGEAGPVRRTDCSNDGGASWTVVPSSLPRGDDAYPVGAYDADGTLYLAEAVDGAIMVAARGAEWSEPVTISPPGKHRMPWLAAGDAGAVAVAWYGTADETPAADSEWFLHVASKNATGDWAVGIADPEPVFVGDLKRELLDFLQAEIGPDGAVHVAYSKVRAEVSSNEQLHYVRTEPSSLANPAYFWGPVLS